MTGTPKIDIAPENWAIVSAILQRHVPDREVWAFGSRAKWTAKPYSDLDLAIGAGRRVSLDETAILAEAFSESDLPYRVDIVDWHAIDASFQRIIAGDRALLIDAVPDVTPPRR